MLQTLFSVCVIGTAGAYLFSRIYNNFVEIYNFWKFMFMFTFATAFLKTERWAKSVGFYDILGAVGEDRLKPSPCCTILL